MLNGAKEILSEQSIILGRDSLKRPDKIIFKDGETIVIDFKTGKNTITKDKAKENLQLACYQLAVALNGFEKKLSGTKSTGVRTLCTALVVALCITGTLPRT
jgi:predicted Ser/Thr protein kinase